LTTGLYWRNAFYWRRINLLFAY